MLSSNMHYMTSLIKAFSESTDDDLKKNGGTMYHYTSPSAFLSIIKNKQIRFSDVRFMNDKSEGIYFVKLLLDYIDEHLSENLEAKDVVDILFSDQQQAAIKALELSRIEFSELPTYKIATERRFLLCASRGPSILSMWNYYIHNNAYEGFSIGFNVPKLLETFSTHQEKIIDPFSVYYGNVIYKKKDQEKEIQSLLKQVQDTVRTIPDKSYEHAAVNLRQYIETRGFFYKHDAFEAEKEFRILVVITDDRLKKEKLSWQSNMREIQEDFFVRNGIVVPCFSITIPDEAISRIYLSPIVEEEIARIGVKELLDTIGYKGVQLCKPNIPIRY